MFQNPCTNLLLVKGVSKNPCTNLLLNFKVKGVSKKCIKKPLYKFIISKGCLKKMSKKILAKNYY